VVIHLCHVTVQIANVQQGGYQILQPKVINIMTTFHGFQQASYMLLTHQVLFRDEEGFYRGDLAGITTVYPILL
jgi:hypothetical protein